MLVVRQHYMRSDASNVSTCCFDTLLHRVGRMHNFSRHDTARVLKKYSERVLSHGLGTVL